MRFIFNLRPVFLAFSLLFGTIGAAHGGLREGIQADYEKNHERAFREFMFAAVAGSPLAQGKVGSYYALGIGRSVYLDEALHWLNLAGQNDDTTGLVLVAGYLLGGDINVTKDCARGRALALKAAAQQRLDAYSLLASSYLNDACGAPDIPEGIKWTIKSAELGDPNAANDLGLYYWNVSNVNGHIAEAKKWFLMAAQEGHAVAMRNMALSYLANDQAVDKVAAVTWMRLSDKYGINPKETRELDTKDLRTLAESLSPAEQLEVDNRVAQFAPYSRLKEYRAGQYQKELEEAVRWDQDHPAK